MRTPTRAQVFAAKVRSEAETFVESKRRPHKDGGYHVPGSQEIYAHLSRIFGIPPHEASRFLTFSKHCKHSWSEGACPDCPSADHLYCP